jgi:glycosyltransferase involved in cell wall biosynthesis
MLVIPNGFDTSIWKPDALARQVIRSELQIDDNSPVVGLVARFHPDKDIPTFIEAAGMLRAKMPEVEFIVCGVGLTPDNSQLMQLFKNAGVHDRLHLLGYRADVPRVVNAFDVATSSSESEAFPNVIGEAMATALPCVVTDVGDSALIVGDTGIVAPPHSPRDLAAAWVNVLSTEPGARIQSGGLARKRIENKFSIEKMIQAYVNLYRNMSCRRS